MLNASPTCRAGASMADKLLGGVYTDVQTLEAFLKVSHNKPAGATSAPPLDIVQRVLVAKRRLPVGTIFPPVHVATKSDVLPIVKKVIQRNLASGYRCVLCKGHRFAYDSLRIAADGESVTYNPGATHKDLFARREWADLLSYVGPASFAQLLSDPSIALFRTLPNNCLHQLTGLPCDDDLRELQRRQHVARSASLSVSSTSAAGPPVNVAATVCDKPIDPLHLDGWWVLPRGDLRLQGAAKGRWLLYCKPMFYQAHLRSASSQALPPEHILNTAISSVPSSLFDTQGSASLSSSDGGRISGASTFRDTLRALGKKPRQLANKQSGPFASISNNSARRLVSHIFIAAPHLMDVKIMNGLPLPPEIECMAKPPPVTTVPGHSFDPASSLNSSSASLVRQPSASSSCLAAVSQPTLARQLSTASSVAPSQKQNEAPLLSASIVAPAHLPSSLTAAVPFYHEMLRRHRHEVDYLRLLDRHCPRLDKWQRADDTAADAEMISAGLSSRKRRRRLPDTIDEG